MILSKTSTYALRILSFMVTQEHELYSAKLLHDELEIPDKYLRRLLTHLSSHGFIKSLQGRNGGYLIEKDLSQIYLSEIIDSIDDFASYSTCILGYKTCVRETACSMHAIWCESRNKMLDVLSKTTLEDLKQHSLIK